MPVHAFGDTKDLGAMAKFLLGDGATYITGQDFAVGRRRAGVWVLTRSETEKMQAGFRDSRKRWLKSGEGRKAFAGKAAG